jgi:GNAT superfamily N-acetyltransferase
MIEIRPILRKEADEFLSLMCKVFSLDFKQARQVFFNEPYFDLSRKWAYFEEGHIKSILTTAPLEFGWGKAVGIAGVATLPSERGRGLAGKVLDEALRVGAEKGEGPAMLFARDERLYGRHGFVVADRVVKGEVRHHGDPMRPEPLPQSDVAPLYDAWAEKDPARLVRDARRWDAWTWTLKYCEKRLDGYVCIEPVLLREAVLPTNLESWPVGTGTIWYGMRGLSEQLGVPFSHTPREELIVMTRHFPLPPRMFMTDQF